MTHPLTPREKVFVSASCEGEQCHCGLPAARKVGEEIMHDDPNPRRHTLTAYVCARHFAEMMGPVGPGSVGYTALASGSGDHAELVGRLEDPNYRGPMQHLRDWSEIDRLFTEAAACIREMVEQRDAARSVIKDTCDKAAGMEGTASDSMIVETVAVLASQCRAYQHLASLHPAPGAEA